MVSSTKITPSSPRLASLLSDVERGNIKIPVFQRQYIWTDEQIVSLLDSIYRGYPVGSLLMWSTKEELKHERNVGGFKLPVTPEDYPVNYILDGQQRLTTLYGVFNSEQTTAAPELADRFNICYLPDEDVFVHHLAASNKVKIHLHKILDTTKLLVELPKYNDEQKSKIAKLTEAFKDYEFPIVTIRDRSNKEVCSIFQRINSSGTPLSSLELLTAWTWSDKFDLRREIDSLLDILSDKGYEKINQPLLMRMLASITCGSISEEDLVDVDPEVLVTGMVALKNAVFAAVDFLEGQLKVRNVVFLPFPIMIIPIVNFYAKINISANTLPELDEDDEEELTAPMDELMVLGKNIFLHGNKASEVPACLACHGASGEGNTPAGYPAIASQHAAYLIKTLTDFKAGTRSSDADNMMVMITHKMSAQEIEAVSYYLSVMK